MGILARPVRYGIRPFQAALRRARSVLNPLPLLLAPVVLVLVLSFGPQARGRAAPVNVDWETPVHLSPGADGAFLPVLRAAPNGRLMVAFNRIRTQNTQNPYFTASGNNGLSWSTPAQIRKSPSDLRQVTLAFDNSSTAHAVWRSPSGLEHAAEPDWPDAANTVLNTTDVVLDPELDIGPDGVLHLVWAQGAPGDPHNIYHAYSTNDGQTWSTPTALATTTEHSSVPVVAVDDSNNVHAVWEQWIVDLDVEGYLRYEIYYKKGTKSGSSYSWNATPTVVSAPLLKAQRPDLLADGNELHVTFSRQASNVEQYPFYTRFRPGPGWSVPQEVSDGKPLSVNTNSPFYLISTMDACGGNLYVSYHGAEETNAKEQIWGSTSANAWSYTDVVTESGLRSINPSMVCAGATLHVVYERVLIALENHQIYYSANRDIFRAHLPVLSRP